MKVALLAIALFSAALASPVPVGNMEYDAGYEDCEEIDVLPAQQMEPFFIEQPVESFEEEDCEDEDESFSEPAFMPAMEQSMPVEEYEDCEEEDSFVEEPAFVDQALNIMNDYEVEDCEEDVEYAAPALIERDQAVDNFYDEECEDEESLPALPAAPQVFEEQEADCEDEGEFMEPFAAAPLDFQPNNVDPLDAAQHAYIMEPQMMGANPSEEFEDCEDEPYYK